MKFHAWGLLCNPLQLSGWKTKSTPNQHQQQLQHLQFQLQQREQQRQRQQQINFNFSSTSRKLLKHSSQEIHFYPSGLEANSTRLQP